MAIHLKRWGTLAALSALLFGPVSSLALTTSGSLPADETWSGDVTITGDVTIPPGVTLTITPGTIVRFAYQADDQGTGVSSSTSELIVQGTLTAAGSAASPIRFTSTSPNPLPGDWYGIRLAPPPGRPP